MSLTLFLRSRFSWVFLPALVITMVLVGAPARAAIGSADAVDVTAFTIGNAAVPATGSVTLSGHYSCTGSAGTALVARFEVTAPAPATTSTTLTGLSCSTLNAAYKVSMTLPPRVSADAGKFTVVLKNPAQNQLAGDFGDVDRLAGTMNEVHIADLSIAGGSVKVGFSARCTTAAPEVNIALGQPAASGIETAVATQTITGCSGTAFRTYTATVTPVGFSFVPGQISADINAGTTSTQADSAGSSTVS